MATISSVRQAACQPVSLAEILSDSGDSHAAAVVRARDGRGSRIAFRGRVIDARIAFGCIVQPEPGDRVLTALADGTTWVTSVLERPSDAPMCLWAEADISITSVRGTVSLLAARSVTIDAGERVRLAAPEIDLHAGLARFVLDELLQIGRRASLYVDKIRHVGDLIETYAEHLLTRARRSSRFVEESDQLRAGDIDQRADGTLQMRAETMLMSADSVVRVDAEQIHMG